MLPRNKYLGLALLLAAGCAGHKPPPAAPAAVPLGVVAPGRVDSMVVVTHRPLLGRLLGLPAARKAVVGGAVGRIGKKAQVSIYYGPATITNTSAARKAQVVAGAGATLTSIEKPRAAVATAPGAVASDYRKQGQRGGAAASGDGATATATTTKGLSWWWLLVPVVGYGGYRVCKRFFIV